MIIRRPCFLIHDNWVLNMRNRYGAPRAFITYSSWPTKPRGFLIHKLILFELGGPLAPGCRFLASEPKAVGGGPSHMGPYTGWSLTDPLRFCESPLNVSRCSLITWSFFDYPLNLLIFLFLCIICQVWESFSHYVFEYFLRPYPLSLLFLGLYRHKRWDLSWAFFRSRRPFQRLCLLSVALTG